MEDVFFFNIGKPRPSFACVLSIAVIMALMASLLAGCSLPGLAPAPPPSATPTPTSVQTPVAQVATATATPTATAAPTATPVISPISTAEPGEQLVLVAGFGTLAGARPEKEIGDAIEEALAKAYLARARVGMVAKTLAEGDSEGARELLKSYGAKLLIWGWSADSGFVVSFTLPGDTEVGFEDARYEPIPARWNEFRVKVSKVDAPYALPLAKLTMGLLYYLNEQYAKALDTFDEAIEDAGNGGIPEGLAGAHFYRGAAALTDAVQNYPRAVEDYSLVIEANAGLMAAYYNRGLAYDKLGDYLKAITDYSKVVELSPDYPAGYARRGRAYIETKEWGRAIEDLTRAISLQPDYAVAYHGRGLAYYSRGETVRAIADYTKAIELAPSYAAPYADRGVAYYDQQRDNEALADFNKAIELNPQVATAYFGRGVIYMLRGEKSKAIDDFEAFLKLSKDPYWRTEAEKYLADLREKE
jgi:tetratricopeptide (TPR) repeat protein